MLFRSNVEMLVGDKVNYLNGLAGPGTSGPETYTQLFDKNVNTKLCTGDNDTAIVFAIDDKVNTFSIVGMSLMGANDDQSYGGRVPKKFTLYGTTNENASPDGEYWSPILSVEETPTGVNYGERYFAFEEESTYRYYMLVMENGEMYQISEIIFYVEKGAWAVTQ